MNVLIAYMQTVLDKNKTLLTGNGSKPMSLVVGDFNNDSIMDIATINSGTHNIGVFLGYNNISFTNQIVYTLNSTISPCSLAAGDFDNDLQLDIVFADCKSDMIGVILGRGNGSFGNLKFYSSNSNSLRNSIASMDINNDTNLDIIVTNQDSNSIGVIFGYGNGTFGSVILFQLEYGSNPFSTMFGDLNGDGKVDMAMINNGTDSLSVLLQTCSDLHG